MLQLLPNWQPDWECNQANKLLQEIISNRWFALLALACSATSGFLWFIGTDKSIWLLPLAGFPVAILYFSGTNYRISPFLITVFSLFILTAVVGVWTAYRPDVAAEKFWILIGSILLFFAIAAQSPKNFSIIFWAISGLSAAISLYFLILHNWQETPADLEFLNNAGRWWMNIRPQLNAVSPEPNFVGGILAVLLILNIAQIQIEISIRRILGIVITILFALISMIGFIMTSSRAAWASFMVGLLILAWWRISTVISKNQKSSWQVFIGGLTFAFALGLILLILFPTQIFTLAKAVPGEASAVTRAGLFINAVDLIPDYWLTGGGLASFAGLYSQYILVIPYLFFKYGHNMYLDITVEQGVFGLIAFLSVVTYLGILLLRGTRKLVFATPKMQILHLAIFSALVVFLLHGLFDDSFYGEKGTPLLFLICGLAAAILHAEDQPATMAASLPSKFNKIPYIKIWVSGMSVVLIGIMIIYLQPLYGNILSNIGAVYQSKIELANFPTGAWENPNLAVQLQSVEPIYRESLWYNPKSRTAYHRLGLIAMYRGDYQNALDYLNQAHLLDPSHRGIYKNLGYAYLWTGDLQRAFTYLKNIPEATRELEAYLTRWTIEEKPELANYTQQILKIFQAAP